MGFMTVSVYNSELRAHLANNLTHKFLRIFESLQQKQSYDSRVNYPYIDCLTISVKFENFNFWVVPFLGFRGVTPDILWILGG